MTTAIFITALATPVAGLAEVLCKRIRRSRCYAWHLAGLITILICSSNCGTKPPLESKPTYHLEWDHVDDLGNCTVSAFDHDGRRVALPEAGLHDYGYWDIICPFLWQPESHSYKATLLFSLERTDNGSYTGVHDRVASNGTYPFSEEQKIHLDRFVKAFTAEYIMCPNDDKEDCYQVVNKSRERCTSQREFIWYDYTETYKQWLESYAVNFTLTVLDTESLYPISDAIVELCTLDGCAQPKFIDLLLEYADLINAPDKAIESTYSVFQRLYDDGGPGPRSYSWVTQGIRPSVFGVVCLPDSILNPSPTEYQLTVRSPRHKAVTDTVTITPYTRRIEVTMAELGEKLRIKIIEDETKGSIQIR